MTTRAGGLRTVAVLAGVAAFTAGCGLSLRELPLGRSGSGETYGVTAVFDSADRIDPGGARELILRRHISPSSSLLGLMHLWGARRTCVHCEIGGVFSQ